MFCSFMSVIDNRLGELVSCLEMLKNELHSPEDLNKSVENLLQADSDSLTGREPKEWDASKASHPRRIYVLLACSLSIYVTP